MLEIFAGLFVVIVAVLGIAILAIPLALLRGWVLSILWGWFIVPYFGMHALPVGYAIGIVFTIGMFTHSASTNCAKDPKTKEWMSILSAYISPLLTLGFAYGVKVYLL